VRLDIRWEKLHLACHDPIRLNFSQTVSPYFVET
jgi:hypothetical protein